MNKSEPISGLEPFSLMVKCQGELNLSGLDHVPTCCMHLEWWWKWKMVGLQRRIKVLLHR